MTANRSRRDFIKSTGCLGIGAAVFSPAFSLFTGFEQSGPGLREVDHYEKLSRKKIQCHVCPLHCILKPGETCFCRTRTNHDGRLFSHAYNNPCILSVDPLEKLPLHHFMPGRKSLSLAFGGCNLRCLYCQNWHQSQVRPDELRTFELTPNQAMATANDREIDILAFAYTEPVVFSEYVHDLTVKARAKGIKSVCATALFVEEKPLRELCRTVDAFSVALKGFDEKFYREMAGSRLAPVLDALQVLKEENVWFEIVNLVIPGSNDNPGTVKKMCRWIAKNLGEDVPVHFGRFVPEYKLKDLPRTPLSTLDRCRKTAQDAGLKYPYIFNVSPHEGNNTFCPSCGKEVVKRLGLRVMQSDLENGVCRHCGLQLPGVFV